jgi:hypothetical protein
MDGMTRKVLSNPDIREAGLRMPPMARLPSLLRGVQLRGGAASVDDLLRRLEEMS